jgi:GTP cyclohydrolase II
MDTREALGWEPEWIRLPSRLGTWRAACYQAADREDRYVVMLCGDLGDGEIVLARIHSACVTGDIFDSGRCDCGDQLEAARQRIAAEGRGLVVYALGHEGRGVGLLNKLQAYRLQDDGLDTVDANLRLGLPVDARDYAIAAALVKGLGIRSVRLLTNNPDKVASLLDRGVRIAERVSVPARATPDNLRYLLTKRDRMGHDLVGIPKQAPSHLARESDTRDIAFRSEPRLPAVTIIVGSQRPGSASAKLGGVITRRLAQGGQVGRVDILDLAATPPPNWSEEFHAREPGAWLQWRPFSDQLGRSDGFVVIVPEWGGMAPPALKNLFLMCDGTLELTDKAALLVGVSATSGGAYPISELRASSYKNTRLCYIPEQVIVRDVDDLFDGDDFGETPEAKRLDRQLTHALGLLAAYAQSLTLVRQRCARDPVEFQWGM